MADRRRTPRIRIRTPSNPVSREDRTTGYGPFVSTRVFDPQPIADHAISAAPAHRDATKPAIGGEPADRHERAKADQGDRRRRRVHEAVVGDRECGSPRWPRRRTRRAAGATPGPRRPARARREPEDRGPDRDHDERHRISGCIEPDPLQSAGRRRTPWCTAAGARHRSGSRSGPRCRSPSTPGRRPCRTRRTTASGRRAERRAEPEPAREEVEPEDRHRASRRTARTWWGG